MPSDGVVQVIKTIPSIFVKLNFSSVIMEKPVKTPDRRPGEMALVAIKQQSKAVQVFKAPKAPIVKKNKVILSEDSYMKVSSKIYQLLVI